MRRTAGPGRSSFFLVPEIGSSGELGLFAQIPYYFAIAPHKDFTFDQFVVGRNNDFAYSASLAMASRRKSDQSCLYLLSKTGLGKSH